jgi:putative ABC transport system ATP-binding protein
MTSLIALKNVWKQYNNEYILRSIDLAVESYDYISIIGRSGVGKTTLIKILGLLDKPDRGDLLVMGTSVIELGDDERSMLRRKYMGIIFQEHNLIPTLSVYENLELYLAIKGFKKADRERRIDELLSLFELSRYRDKYPGELSAGEQQRIAIIRALSGYPSVILADEPVSNLDDESAELVLELLTEVNREEGVAIVYTSTGLYGEPPSKKRYRLEKGILKEVG